MGVCALFSLCHIVALSVGAINQGPLQPQLHQQQTTRRESHGARKLNITSTLHTPSPKTWNVLLNFEPLRGTEKEGD